MILKIRNPGFHAWMFYEIRGRLMVSEDPPKPWDLGFYTAIWANPEVAENQVFYCQWVLPDGSEERILADQAFLLNDAGKTIEKL